MNAPDHLNMEIGTDMEELLKRLRELANKRCAHEVEGWCTDDSGNFDDTYAAGQRSGEIEMARDVLAVLDPSFKLDSEPG